VSGRPARWPDIGSGSQRPGQNSSARSVALRWPSDPYMHVNLVACDAGGRQQGWPKSVDQLGSTVLTLQVADLDLEVRRLVDDGARIRVDAETTARLSGPTRSAYIEDPDGNVVELLECFPGRGWDYTSCTVAGAQTTFLHLQLNTYDYEAMSRFYAGFGFAPDPLSEGRPNVDYRQLIDMSRPNPYIEAFGRPLNNKVTNSVTLFQLAGDHSEMHLEIMGWNDGNLVVPGPDPTFHQLGIMRYCFKTVRHLDVLAELKRRGVHVLIENQLGAYKWGDSEWFYFADPDGNVLCFEEWFPAGRWGEKV
jgi:catechol 2,3-dioxygenase-like lactoylglutathione lyase family enzyme